MSANSLFSEERRAKILEMIHVRKKLTVNELCDILEVSAATVRTDLRDLDREGLLVRTHGGALEKSRASFELTSSKRNTLNLTAKQGIAKAAEELIEDGDTILLDTGTTTLELAKRIAPPRHFTVITNDLDIARVLEEVPGVEVVLLGGSLRKGYHCTLGPSGLLMTQGLHVDKAFMATNSLSLRGGATTPILAQADVKKSMIAMARKVFLLCDSSKIGVESFACFAELDDLDVLITEKMEPATREEFERHGMEVIVTDKPA